MKEDLRRETHGTAIGGDRPAARRRSGREPARVAELARLGARLIIQRAVEDEFDAWLGRARYERRPDHQRGLRNGFRPRRVQTAEGELSVELRQAAEPFVSKLLPRGTKL